jgi:hypothetical protein
MVFLHLEFITIDILNSWAAGPNLKVVSTTSVGFGEVACLLVLTSRGSSSYHLQTMSIYVHCIDGKCDLVIPQMFSPMQVRAY